MDAGVEGVPFFAVAEEGSEECEEGVGVEEVGGDPADELEDGGGCGQGVDVEGVVGGVGFGIGDNGVEGAYIFAVTDVEGEEVGFGAIEVGGELCLEVGECEVCESAVGGVEEGFLTGGPGAGGPVLGHCVSVGACIGALGVSEFELKGVEGDAVDEDDEVQAVKVLGCEVRVFEFADEAPLRSMPFWRQERVLESKEFILVRTC